MNENRQHEPDAVNAKLLVVCAISLMLVIALALVVVRGTIAVLAGDVAPVNEHANATTSDANAPKVTPDQAQQLHQLREAEEHRLNHYDWIDEQAGVAQIPIDRAMAILAAQGLPKTATTKEKDDEPTEN